MPFKSLRFCWSWRLSVQAGCLRSVMWNMSRGNTNLTDDAALVTRLKGGDKRAFSALYDRYHAYIYHLSLRFLRSPEWAEEAVQDVFVKLWENRERLQPELGVKGFLIRCCKNHLLNLLARPREILHSLDEVAISPASAAPTPLEELISLEFGEAAEKYIARLPPLRQKVFRMYRMESKSLDEIARELGTSRGTVKDHILKATRFLKSYVKQLSGMSLDPLFALIAAAGSHTMEFLA